MEARPRPRPRRGGGGGGSTRRPVCHVLAIAMWEGRKGSRRTVTTNREAERGGRPGGVGEAAGAALRAGVPGRGWRARWRGATRRGQAHAAAGCMHGAVDTREREREAELRERVRARAARGVGEIRSPRCGARERDDDNVWRRGGRACGEGEGAGACGRTPRWKGQDNTRLALRPRRVAAWGRGGGARGRKGHVRFMGTM